MKKKNKKSPSNLDSNLKYLETKAKFYTIVGAALLIVALLIIILTSLGFYKMFKSVF